MGLTVTSEPGRRRSASRSPGALAKSVPSLEDLREFIRLRERTYTRRVYDYFCGEPENMLLFGFGLTETVENIG